jgi:hypothetical protein
MPKKIEDVLNPKPPTTAIDENVLGYLREAKADGDALTAHDIMAKFTPKLPKIGEGGLVLGAISMAIVQAALDRLTESGQVQSHESHGGKYYWTSDD